MAGSNDFIDLVERMIDDKLADTHTVTTAIIIKINENTVDVKPVFKRLVDGVEYDYPIFTNVPPLFNYGGDNYISFPLSVGDYCKLIVDERCLDNWYEGLDDKTPLEYRFFDYSDSSAWVSCKPKAGAIPIPTDGRTNMIGDTYQNGEYEHIGDRQQDGDYTLNGNQLINGNLTVNGVGGGGSSEVNNTTLTFDSNSDIIIDGVSLKDFINNHTHTSNGSGNETSTPNI